MGSFKAIWYNIIRWLEINIVTFFANNSEKENAFLSAVVEEVKHWRSLIHWTPQTFSSRPRVSLCGVQTPTENLSSSCCFLLWSTVIWRDAADTTHTSSVRSVRMNRSNIYTHLRCEKYIPTTFDVLNTRHKFLELIQSFFALKKGVLDRYPIIKTRFDQVLFSSNLQFVSLWL